MSAEEDIKYRDGITVGILESCVNMHNVLEL